jgi:hypothetical protein
MTTTITASRPLTSRGAVTGIGLAAAVVAAAGTAVGAHDWRELLVVVAVIAATTALVFGLVVPRAMARESAGGTALGLAIPALLLLLPAFWSGLPFVLGVAAIVVGNAGRRAPTGAGKCLAGLVLGTLAAIGYVAIYVSDAMNGGAGFLFS